MKSNPTIDAKWFSCWPHQRASKGREVPFLDLEFTKELDQLPSVHRAALQSTASFGEGEQSTSGLCRLQGNNETGKILVKVPSPKIT